MEVSTLEEDSLEPVVSTLEASPELEDNTLVDSLEPVANTLEASQVLGVSTPEGSPELEDNIQEVSLEQEVSTLVDNILEVDSLANSLEVDSLANSLEVDSHNLAIPNPIHNLQPLNPLFRRRKIILFLVEDPPSRRATQVTASAARTSTPTTYLGSPEVVPQISPSSPGVWLSSTEVASSAEVPSSAPLTS